MDRILLDEAIALAIDERDPRLAVVIADALRAHGCTPADVLARVRSVRPETSDSEWRTLTVHRSPKKGYPLSDYSSRACIRVGERVQLTIRNVYTPRGPVVRHVGGKLLGYHATLGLAIVAFDHGDEMLLDPEFLERETA